MKKIDRYLPVLKKDRTGKLRASVHKDPYGRYVLFSTHVERVEKLKREIGDFLYLQKKIRDLEEENERLRTKHHDPFN